MKKEKLVPSTVRENEFLSLAVTCFIFEVGERQTRNISAKEEVEKVYYSSSARDDLVCYRAIDVYRVAMSRRNVWPDPWPKELMNGFIQKNETYQSAKRVIINRPREEVEEVKPVPQEPTKPVPVLTEELMDKMATLIVDKLIAGLPKHLKEPPEKRSSKHQFYGTLVSVSMFACFMFYVAMKAREVFSA